MRRLGYSGGHDAGSGEWHCRCGNDDQQYDAEQRARASERALLEQVADATRERPVADCHIAGGIVSARCSNRQQGLGVIGRGDMTDSNVVGSELRLANQRVVEHPDQRIAPIERGRQPRSHQHKPVKAADMRQLMCDHGFGLRRRALKLGADQDPGRGHAPAQGCRDTR
jgi:hypothetical protein